MQGRTSLHVLQIYEEQLVEIESSMVCYFVVLIEFEVGILQVNPLLEEKVHVHCQVVEWNVLSALLTWVSLFLVLY